MGRVAPCPRSRPYLLQGLKDHGAREIFGIPGDFVLPFFKVIEDSGILPHYTLSHEPAVGFAADAAARYHCGLGVAVVTYGAGAFNLVNAIAGAYAERSPVVVIAGAPGARERASGFCSTIRRARIDTQLAVYREITCDQAVLTDAETAPAEIARVLRSARERSLPVYIELPRDLTAAPALPVPVLPRRSADPEALAECADEIIAKLADAKAAGDPGRRGNPPLRPRAAGHRAGAQARPAGGDHVHGPRSPGGRARRPASAPISAPPAIPPSPGWSRTPTRCCCSASSSPTPISRCRSAGSIRGAPCSPSIARSASAITSIPACRSTS